MADIKTQPEERFVKVDPQSIQDALRLFFQPTKTGDLRTDFYSAYQKEAAEYDAHFVKQYDEDLNTTLIFAGLFSAVCSAFVIDVQGNLQPDPVDTSTAYLEAILRTLQNPGSAGNGTVLPTWNGPPSTDVTVSALLYTSLSTSMLAAFLAMLGKQWLNRYVRRQGGSAAERCGDRQRKLNGLQRWPFRIVIESLPILLQISLLLLGAALSRFLWGVNRMVASIVTGFTAYGILFYVCIIVTGTLSYESPFQTPASLILRSLGVDILANKLISIFFPNPGRFNPDADCIFWTLDMITDPEVTTAALRYLTSIKWHYNPPETVPLQQVARIYMKCFDSGYRLLTESRDMAYAAGWALIQLYAHRLCSNMDSAHTHQAVAEAFNHLSEEKHSGQLRSLSLIAKSFREPGWGATQEWEVMDFDLLWISELWVHYAWFWRTQRKDVGLGGVIRECNMLVTVRGLFKNEESPPTRVVQNIFQGLLAGVSSSTPPPFDEAINTKYDGSFSQLFSRLESELVQLVPHELPLLQEILQPLVPWKHNRMEVVDLCCNLLKTVMKRTPRTTRDLPGLIYLLFRIAFRRKMQGIRACADLFLPETLEKLAAFVRHGDTEFINDLSSAFTSISWHENQRHHIVWTTLNIPATLLSPTLQSALVPLFGTTRWSLVESLDRKELADFIGRLPIDEIVQHIVDDGLVCVGWMRLLLFTIFRPPRQMNTRPLWRILLAALPKIPHFFSRDLPGYFDPSKFPFPDSNDNYDPEMRMKEEEALWMILFWSSRFFEMDSEQWPDFKDATTGLGQRRPVLLERLEKLCFGLEEEAQAGLNVATVRTKAFTEMVKVGQGVDSIKHSQNFTSQAAPASAAERTTDAEKMDPLRPQRVAPRAARPSNNPPPPPTDEGLLNRFTKPPRITPQNTPQSVPRRRGQNTITKIQVVLHHNSPSVEPFHQSPVRRTPPSPPLSLQERLESLTLTDSDRLSYLSTHSRSREFLGVTSQPQLLPGGGVPPLLPNAGNSELADSPSLSFWMRRREEGHFDDEVHPSRQPQVPRINPIGQSQNAAVDIIWPSHPLTVALRDAPPVSRTTRRQSIIPSQVQQSSPPSPIMSAGPPPPLPRQPQPPPPSRARSETPITINDDDGQYLSSIQSGSRVGSSPPDPGPQPMHLPVLPERSETESPSGRLQSLVADGGGELH